MRLSNTTALVYGGSGAIGAATARAFAAEGAHVCLVGRTEARLRDVVSDIWRTGGSAEFAVLDILDAAAVNRHAEELAGRGKGIDIVLNAVSFMHVQGVVLDDLLLEQFREPVDQFLNALFNAAKAVAPHMGRTRTGVFLTLSTPAANRAPPGHLGYGVTCAATEAFTRLLADEMAPRNTRTACIRSHAIGDAPAAGSYTAALFADKARQAGLTVDQWLQGAGGATLRGKLPTLAEVAGTAVYLASGDADSLTGTVVDLTAGI